MQNENSTNWIAVCVLFAAGCTASFHIGKVPAALPILTTDLSLSLFDASLVVSLFSVFIGCAGLLLGLVAGRLGYRVAAVLGLSMAGVASFCSGWSNSLVTLLLWRSFEGIGWILTAVSIPVLMSGFSTIRDRPLVLGLWGAFVPVGMFVMLVMTPAILDLAGWRDLWRLTGLMSVSGAAVVYWQTRGVEVQSFRSGGIAELRSVVWRLAPLLMCLCFFIYSALFTQVNSFVPTLLLDLHATKLELAAWMAALVVTGNIIGNVGAGWLLRRGVNRFTLISVACIMMGLLSLFIFPAHVTLWLRVLAAFLFSAFGGLIPGTLFATGPLVVAKPEQVGLINGLILQFAGLGQLMGPPLLAAVVSPDGDWSRGVLVTLLLAGMGLGLARVFARVGIAATVPEDQKF